MKIVEIINIAKDFTDAPGARYKTDGPKSGEEFYEELLLPKYKKAIAAAGKLQVNFDDAWGFASSFLSGSFGRLSVEHGGESILVNLELKSDQDSFLIDKVIRVIKNPEHEVK